MDEDLLRPKYMLLADVLYVLKDDQWVPDGMGVDALRAAVKLARAVAGPAGPQHGYWDYISEAEAILDGRPTVLSAHRVARWFLETFHSTISVGAQDNIPDGARIYTGAIDAIANPQLSPWRPSGSVKTLKTLRTDKPDVMRAARNALHYQIPLVLDGRHVTVQAIYEQPLGNWEIEYEEGNVFSQSAWPDRT